MLDVFLRTWDLGFTSFGGPPVHFRILHERFVQGKGGKEKWVDEQTVRSRPVPSKFCLARPFNKGYCLTDNHGSTRSSLRYARVFLAQQAQR